MAEHWSQLHVPYALSGYVEQLLHIRPPLPSSDVVLQGSQDHANRDSLSKVEAWDDQKAAPVLPTSPDTSIGGVAATATATSSAATAASASGRTCHDSSHGHNSGTPNTPAPTPTAGVATANTYGASSSTAAGVGSKDQLERLRQEALSLLAKAASKVSQHISTCMGT